MSYSKQQRWTKTVNEGLRSANRGNPFWTKADAMGNINRQRAITRRQAALGQYAV